MELKFSTEKQEDYKQVFRLNQMAFEQDAEAKLVNALRLNTKAFIPELSILAKINGKLVGYILFTNNFIINAKGQANKSLTLAPLAIHPKYQKKGIGKELIQRGLAKAKMLGFNSVIVLGHSEYYSKFGFTGCFNWGIRAPFEVPDEALMALELNKNGLLGIQGTIHYPKEFDTI